METRRRPVERLCVNRGFYVLEPCSFTKTPERGRHMKEKRTRGLVVLSESVCVWVFAEPFMFNAWRLVCVRLQIPIKLRSLSGSAGCREEGREAVHKKATGHPFHGCCALMCRGFAPGANPERTQDLTHTALQPSNALSATLCLISVQNT